MTHSSNLTLCLPFLLLLAVMQGCFGNKSDLPPHVEQAKNLTILQQTENPPIQFEFEREIVFDDSLLLDKINDIEVDEYGRVFIAGEGWGRRQVHIFDVNGTHIDNLGTLGRGFGEFLGIDRIRLLGDTVYLFDEDLSRVTTYDTQTQTWVDTLSFRIDHLKLPEGIDRGYFQAFPITVVNSGRYLLGLRNKRNPAYEPEGTIRYYLSNAEGVLTNKEVTVQPDLLYQVGDYAGRPAPFTLSLPEQSLFGISGDNELYVAHTSEFFVQIFDEEGEEQRAFYHRYNRRLMDPDEVIHPQFSHNKQLLRVRESAEYPRQWPALYSMLADDQNRLWVSTIPDNRNELEWWVINQANGTIDARFTWPLDRLIIRVQNGSVFAIEKNAMGFKNVVRYRIKQP